MLIGVLVLCVHEIKVKIIYAQNFKLTFDKGFDVLFAVEKKAQ